MPKITIDRDVLVREIDDLVRVNKDADDKGKALDDAKGNRDSVKAAGEADILTAQDKADADLAVAEAELTAATVDSQVADTLLTRQIDHLKALVSGQADDPDPTDDTPAPAPSDQLVTAPVKA